MTFYTSRSKYGGMEVSDAKRLKGLEEKKRKLTKFLSAQLLDNARRKGIPGKIFYGWFKEERRELGDREERLPAQGLGD